MLRRLAQFAFAAALLFLCAGCSLHKKPKGPVTRAPQAADVGTIALVDENGRFALIDHGDKLAPPVGGILKTYGAGMETGDLVVTEVRRGVFTIADIRSGAPHKGDRVLFIPANAVKMIDPSQQPVPASSPAPNAPAVR
jgi:hypothetical protein